ncbi:Tip elongation aberrant protein 1 [Colletotrichum fructicola]|uniref:Tip elongation aberrant protein 1 n=2 Tax=Colletotrichum fructicola (strain Nara gc5) TaxID=1213859 RepID=A0A7J6IWB7_COLFN|nr:Tip elongation aberrant protein 1 [Colletotrichum fructicola]KAF4481383.1 Tip elongation aberrant protein 1 [Colletotrichum fructicola Nara gc5]KAF4901122.1 Tip elongation aberrant protein 1 [Colletotrichum fructicola]KAF4911539.1 Tip elongation aberrant protein 1 [Colletotrichum fructicola]KAF4939212.1 Tip elongation aberrant protein 1 [Colletotrichum fructicola]
MAFLFKSKKNQDRALASRDVNSGGGGSQSSIQSASARIAREEKNATQRSTPTGSVGSIDHDGSAGAGSPDVGYGRQRGPSVDQTSSQPPSSDLPLRNGPPVSQQNISPQQQQMMNPNASLYPWSQRRLTYTSSHPSPFPRYGAAVNSVSSKEGDIYVMGGLINSSTVKGDLWMIEAGQNMACYPLATTAEGPGPRVGHASLLVGNAFIVYGGDTKVDEMDVLDETLYLLNTSTRQWSRALPAGTRPSGRYGHSLNILGSKIYIFGGQIEGYFMNDLSAFDLNQLQMPNNRWEMLIQNTESGGPAVGKIPAARTNHSVVTFNDKMYLFGGTNGYQWFNDVWSYDPATNEWSQLDCIGYIPVPREGHAAAIVDDVMYIFGGRTEEGADLGDLAAFRITSRRWYTFQNMGPSPSPRSGHSMTTVGKAVVVVGGEPSSSPASVGDLGIVYMLDTTKIRYPNDAQAQQTVGQPQQQQRIQGARRPSAAAETRNLLSRDGSNGPPDQRKLVGAPREANAMSSPPNGMRGPNGAEPNNNPAAVNNVSKVPRSAAASPPAGPPPSGPTPAKPNQPSNVGRIRGQSSERDGSVGSPQLAQSQSPVIKEVKEPGPKEAEIPVTNGRRTPQEQVKRSGSRSEQGPSEAAKTKSRQGSRSGNSVDSTTEPGLRAVQPPPQSQPQPQPQPQLQQLQPPPQQQQLPPQQPPPQQQQPTPPQQVSPQLQQQVLQAQANRPASPPPPTRQPSNPLNRRSSGRNSQTVALLKELDTARNRNAWYASELELARKAGYVPNASLSPVLDSRAAETFDDEDKPLIEALLAMRTELANVQASVDKQAILAAKQIAEAEKQRDAAIQEAVYAKAKLVAQVGGSVASTPQLDGERDVDDRSTEISRKLAYALNYQKDLQAQVEMLKSELEAEKRARQLADDTTNASQKRMSELESYKTMTSTDLEQLKAELHMVQKEAREQAVQYTEAMAAMQLLKVEREDFEKKYNESVGNSKEQNNTFDSLREAMAASVEMKAHLESKLEEERAQREKLESKLTKLKSEHETRTAELVAATQRLRDAEELAEKHANEARTHQQAILAGFDKVTTRDLGSDGKADSEKLKALQEQLNAANALVKKYQQEADSAADKLRTAEERIAGLEVYQEQSSREGVAIRRQLQAALRETQSLQARNSDLKHQLQNQQLETNAMTVQHNTLKDILVERGISPTNMARTRSIGSPRVNTPEQARIRDLEDQLSAATTAQEESAQRAVAQQEATEAAYREKLTQLENDYQSAVHYVKGTEKMLKQLKEQLSRYKTENNRLKSELLELEERVESSGAAAGGDAPANWESERHILQEKIESLEEDLQASTEKLENQLLTVRKELEDSKKQREGALKDAEEASRKLAVNRRDLEELQQENNLLERRAQDAEQKVSLLLDQVESSVDSYRRQSRQAPSMTSEETARPTNGNSIGHQRQDSSDAESSYGGAGGVEGRNSTALDNLANELETLRTHWEATNKNYRLSNTFDFEGATTPTRKDEEVGLGLSESLADWRKRLDVDEQADNDRAKTKSRPDRP